MPISPGGTRSYGTAEGPYGYVHNQSTPAATWTIDHNLGWHPNVTVINSAGDVVMGDMAYQTLNRVVLTFNGAFSGTAYLS